MPVDVSCGFETLRRVVDGLRALREIPTHHIPLKLNTPLR